MTWTHESPFEVARAYLHEHVCMLLLLPNPRQIKTWYLFNFCNTYKLTIGKDWWGMNRLLLCLGIETTWIMEDLSFRFQLLDCLHGYCFPYNIHSWTFDQTFQQFQCILDVCKWCLFASNWRKKACPLQPSDATWPLRLMLGKCIKMSLWLSTRRFWIMTN